LEEKSSAAELGMDQPDFQGTLESGVGQSPLGKSEVSAAARGLWAVKTAT